MNVAARLESIGEPGGVTVSGTVFDQVKNRLQVGFDFIGEQQVKNIAELVRAYRVVAEGTPVSRSARPKRKQACGDPEQDYFSDGVTEDVITSLSTRPGLFVIARNSVSTYKGLSPNR